MRELKRERAQLLRGGEAAEARGPGVLQARNQGVDGDMSLQDMFTGLQRRVLLLPLISSLTLAHRLKERMGSAGHSQHAVSSRKEGGE